MLLFPEPSWRESNMSRPYQRLVGGISVRALCLCVPGLIVLGLFVTFAQADEREEYQRQCEQAQREREQAERDRQAQENYYAQQAQAQREREEYQRQCEQAQREREQADRDRQAQEYYYAQQ